MELRAGWNAKYGAWKFDVSMDEGDLERVLLDADLPPDMSLSVAEAFGLLRAEAESYSLLTFIQESPKFDEPPSDNGIAALKNEVRQHLSNKAALLAKLRKRHAAG